MILTSLTQQGHSQRYIAQLLGRSPSTISRELRRNAEPQGYAYCSAQQRCQQRRIAARPLPKLHAGGALWFLVSSLLTWCCSPQQIAHTLRRTPPHDPSRRISHESIYNAIYAHPKGELRNSSALLRQGKSTRRPRSAGKGAGMGRFPRC
ncbi:transposase [Extensimonas sp. H3M7-6]|uniref:transposase n=1 Tax=Extensimonas soli TaxID=3031322 RepID=UPI00387EA025